MSLYLEDPFKNCNVGEKKGLMSNKLHDKQSEHSTTGFFCRHRHIRNTLRHCAFVQSS